jgi:hypothetical protein
MTQTEALRLALEWFEKDGEPDHHPVVTAIKEALAQQEHDYKDLYEKEKRKSAMWLAKYEEVAGPAPKAIPMVQPEQEPVAFINVEQRKLEWAKYMSWDTPTVVNLPKIPLYTTPPQRTWVGLTRMELIKCGVLPFGMSYELCQAIEAKLKEKNT